MTKDSELPPRCLGELEEGGGVVSRRVSVKNNQIPMRSLNWRWCVVICCGEDIMPRREGSVARRRAEREISNDEPGDAQPDVRRA